MRQIYNILLISAMSLFLFACQGDEEALSEQVGYLRVALEQSKDVNTKAAAAYNPKQMHVVIKNEQGEIKFQTDDHTADLEGKQIALAPGKYTIEAKSNGYDSQSGADRAYYVGNSEVTIVKDETAQAKVVCSLANVKVTVAFEQSFLDKLGAGTIKVQVKSATATAVTTDDFNKSATAQVSYFPLGDLTVDYTVVSADGKKNNSDSQQITGVKAKDHYILNFKEATGTGNVTVKVDPTMHLYTYDFTVDPTKTSGALLTANAWSRMAYLTATEISGNVTYPALKFQYRQKGAEQWTDVETTPQAEASKATATIKGLTAATEYEYRLLDGEVEIAKDVSFTTETEVPLQNGNLDDWVGDFPNADENSKFWDTSNKGASMGGLTPTTAVTDVVNTPGGKAAKLVSGKVKIGGGIFAAASLYTGTFGKANMFDQSATVNFGQSFSARPIALKGFYKYIPKVIDIVKRVPAGVTIEAGKTMDMCSIYIALAKKTYTINNADENTFINFKEDPNIIAYGELPSGAATAGDGYVEFNIPLKYKNLTDQPTHIIVVCSSSKYGDYMTGGEGSTLYVDDLSLIYDGEPTMWK